MSPDIRMNEDGSGEVTLDAEHVRLIRVILRDVSLTGCTRLIDPTTGQKVWSNRLADRLLARPEIAEVPE